MARHPGKESLEQARRNVALLRTQEAFRRAPALTSFGRLQVLEMLVRMATGLELPRWNVRMFFSLPSEKVSESLYLLFVITTKPELAYWKRSFRQGNFMTWAPTLAFTRVASKLAAGGRVIAIAPTGSVIWPSCGE